MKFIFTLLLVFTLTTYYSDAQLGGLKKLLEKKTEEKIKKKLEGEEEQESEKKDEDENEAKDGKNESKTQKTELKSFSKFDFIPGDTVIWFQDFTETEVGDFPASWNTNGSGEVMTNNLYPGKWLKMNSEGFFIPEIPGNFTDNFTVEFDAITITDEERLNYSINFYLVSGNLKDPREGGAIPGKAGVNTSIESFRTGFSSYSNGSYTIDGTNNYEIKPNQKYHISYWVQKSRLRIYIDDKKVIDAPRALDPDFHYNILRFEDDSQGQPMITNFRVAAGKPDTRNKLVAQGRFVTHGILFDSGSDKIKPESYGTLKDIAAVLSDNPTIRYKIIGHTDSDGKPDANLELSKKRSEAVKNALVNEFKVDAERFETDGKGATEPVSENSTPEGKANNRRVEFIKL